MPWRGRQYPGEFPTLGYTVQDWIEQHLVVPDGPLVGEPFRLTDEQVRFLLWHYRLDLQGRWAYRGSQLMRSQKWGKSPLIAAVAAAEALGPVRFAGWDEHTGEPLGVAWATPWIQIAAVSEEQTSNIFRPLFTMLAEGPLSDPEDPRYTEDLDVGETRVNLPGGGRIEPVTSQAKSRLGARLTFSAMDETHLWTESSGGVDLAATMKRNLAGMGGRFVEVTNAYDPSENSVGQRTHTGGAADVRLDWRPSPDPTVSLDNRAELKRALRHCYGDSHWVDLDRIIAEIRDPTTSPADAKRYFLSLIVVGDKDFLDPIAWDAAARGGHLGAGDRVTLGFDGSKRQDATSLVACRIHDGRLFKLRTWQRPINAPADWRVPTADVDAVVGQAFDAYDVWYMFADPAKWQDYLDRWAARWPKRIVLFDTNSERRMDQALERFLTAFRAGEVTHDGDPVMAAHIKAAALAKGKRKQARDDNPETNAGLGQFYLRLVKKRMGKIDDAIAVVLAYEARGHAIEEGALVDNRYDLLKSVG